MDRIDGSRIFIVQHATIGRKYGWDDDPEGAWADHQVFGDFAEAQAEARKLETLPLHDAKGKNISAEVVTTTRVITLDEYRSEMSADRLNRLLTAYRTRLVELGHQQLGDQL